ncbi:polysaccharide biosynthesis tyrosine autokinase [Plantactinospora sp. KBS50]|uniref:polysaccharide biosynthesis tyrosine autokinase n=1 Tax=Plantactinospora sp. KBS50 TaxID=2024580 RepID=UPI001E2B911B|nr:polysaccharide biosynthesis tyrosine autokinase [Plantactinospora sp. KBS50]
MLAPNEQGITGAYTGSLFLEQRVKSYADLLTSDRLAQAVAADGDVGLTAQEIQRRVAAKPRTDTVLLDTTITDTDQARALRLAEAVSTAFRKLVQTIETRPGEKDPLVKIEVVNGPRVSPTPVSPQPTRNLGVGALLGVLAGIGLAMLRGLSDSAVRDGATLSRITGAPLLAQIPYDREVRRSQLITGAAGRSPRAESMRNLRTNLRFVDLQEPARVIAVTSAVQGEGKSTTACNLAIALVEAGWRVVLVDADLRRPQVGEYLDVGAGVGLTDVLLGEVELADALRTWRDTSLLVLPAGAIPPNPSELLGSKAMADLLGAVRELADIVVIDTAPLLAVTDGVVVSVQADGALLVTRQGRTDTVQLTAAVEALRRVDARLLGCALNMAKLDRAAATEYYAYRAGGAESGSRHGVRTGAGHAAPTQAARSAAAPGLPSGGDATTEFSRIPR